MHFSTKFAALGVLATTAWARDFYILAGNDQVCPCAAISTDCPCTTTTISGIVPVDEWGCDWLGENTVDEAAPDYCNNDPAYPVTDRFEMRVKGCAHDQITFSIDASGDFYNVHIPGSENEAMIRATCTAPPQCEVGNPDSQVFWDSEVCVLGAGEQILVDALWKCTDFTANSNDLFVCP